MFLHITKIEMKKGSHEVKLFFNNNEAYTVNLFDSLSGEIFEPLRDDNLFKRGYLNPLTGTIEWENGADFAPEYLLDVAKKQHNIAA